jgi:hypothetical protein
MISGERILITGVTGEAERRVRAGRPSRNGVGSDQAAVDHGTVSHQFQTGVPEAL